MIVRRGPKQVPRHGIVAAGRKQGIEAANCIFSGWKDLEEKTYAGHLKDHLCLGGQGGEFQFAVAPHDCGQTIEKKLDAGRIQVRDRERSKTIRGWSRRSTCC